MDRPVQVAAPIWAAIGCLLETEMRIIAEDTTHVVIALRVRKDVIQRNLAFLAVLAER
jgi:hypothetical protein